MGCSLTVFLEYFFVYTLSQAFILHSGLFIRWMVSQICLNCPHKWVYYSIISKLMLLLLDLLQVPSDVTFETLTAELKSLLGENWISDRLRDFRIKCSCWFVLSSFWGRKVVFLGVFLPSDGLGNLCALPLFPAAQCKLCRSLRFWTPDVFLFDIDFKWVCWCMFSFVVCFVCWLEFFSLLKNTLFSKFSCRFFFFKSYRVLKAQLLWCYDLDCYFTFG